MLAEALDPTLQDPLPPKPAALDKERRRCPTCGRDLPATYLVCPRDATPLGVPLDHARDPLIGAVLAGTYRLSRVLGRGGMGKLYEAEHARLGRRFAVKVLHEGHADRKEAVARFEREAQALARIRSDFVLDVVDVLRAPDGRMAIVTDLLEGEDLQHRLDRAGSLPASEAVEIAREVCRGLAAAHAVGVVHRDLKPSNVFLAATPDGRTSVKILDFGVAKLIDESEVTKSGVVLGTPAYMAPEQARGSSKADARADLYAVGALLYRMLTGCPPYEGSEAGAILAELILRPPARPRDRAPHLDAALELVIQRAMSREPSARPTSALALETELSNFGHEDGEAVATLRLAPGREAADTTLVLPHGAVDRAEELAKSAKRARPGLLAQAALGTAASAAASAGAIAALSAWAMPASSDASLAFGRALAIVASVAVALGIGSAIAIRARARWASAAECEQLSARLRTANVRGLGLIGALFLLSAAASALQGTPPALTAWVAVASLCAPLLVARELR